MAEVSHARFDGNVGSSTTGALFIGVSGYTVCAYNEEPLGTPVTIPPVGIIMVVIDGSALYAAFTHCFALNASKPCGMVSMADVGRRR